jgi:hypothetical protein
MMRTEMKVDDVKDLVGHVLSELAAARQASEGEVLRSLPIRNL